MTGGDQSYDDFNLFEGFCGLASTCFPIWVELVSWPTCQDIDEFVADKLRVPSEFGSTSADVAQDLERDPDLDAIVADGNEVRRHNEVAFQAERLENQRDHKKALKFLGADPLPHTLAFRQILGLGMELLKGITKMGGWDWEIGQWIVELKALQAKRDGADIHPTTLQRRTYAIVEAAKNT